MDFIIRLAWIGCVILWPYTFFAYSIRGKSYVDWARFLAKRRHHLVSCNARDLRHTMAVAVFCNGCERSHLRPAQSQSHEKTSSDAGHNGAHHESATVSNFFKRGRPRRQVAKRYSFFGRRSQRKIRPKCLHFRFYLSRRDIMERERVDRRRKHEGALGP